MPKKKKEEEILAELGGVTQEQALDSIHAANQAFKKEKADFDENEKVVEEQKKRTKTVVDNLEIVDAELTKSTKDLTQAVSTVSLNDSIPDGLNKNSLPKVNLIKNPDGSVNWRKMIKSEFIVFNEKDYKDKIEKQYGKPLGELTVDEVDDKYLLILLPGFKEVAKLRGFHSVTYPSITAQPEFVSVYCQIDWKPFFNGETWEDGFVQGDGADCTINNGDDLAKRYLTAFAFNRAFVRAVRTSLNIHVAGKDEIGPAVKMESASGEREVSLSNPRAVLEQKITKMGRTVETLGKWWADLKDCPEAKNWKTIDDIDSNLIFDILGEFKALEEQKRKK